MSAKFGSQSRTSSQRRRDQESFGRRGGQQDYRHDDRRGEGSRDAEDMQGGDDDARYWRQQRDEDYGSRGRQGYYSESIGSGQEYAGYGEGGEYEGSESEDWSGQEERMSGGYGPRQSGRGRRSGEGGGYQDYGGFQRQEGGEIGGGAYGMYDEDYAGSGQYQGRRSGGRREGYSGTGGGYRGSRGMGSRSQSDVMSQIWSESDRSGYGSPGMSRGEHYGKGPKGYQRSDERIAEEVNERLTYDASLDASDIEVSVSKGEVTLKGQVDGRRAKRLAEDLAEQVRGVNEVHNQLRTRRDGGSEGKTGRGESESGRSKDKSDKEQRTSL